MEVFGGSARLPGLKVLDTGQHVQVARRVLLDHVHDVVGPQALLEPPLRHQELHDAEGEKSKMSLRRRTTIIAVKSKSIHDHNQSSGESLYLVAY